MKQSLSLLPAKMGIGIAQDEANGCKEVTLAGTIATDDHIVFRGEGLDDRLVLVAEDMKDLVATFQVSPKARSEKSDIPFEALNDNLLDIHLRGARRDNQMAAIATTTSRIQQFQGRLTLQKSSGETVN